MLRDYSFFIVDGDVPTIANLSLSRHSSGTVEEHFGPFKLLIGTQPHRTLMGCSELVCNVYLKIVQYVGAWRSLVAHYTGGVGVVGSNPIAPTT